MHLKRTAAGLLCILPIFAKTLTESNDASSRDRGLRLIKTSEDDPGQWVTEDQKITDFKAKHINFIDVTDIPDIETFDRLSTNNGSLTSSSTPYPLTIRNELTANDLMGIANTDGPKDWLKTLTNFFNRYYRSTTGLQAANWLYSQVQNMTASNPDIKVSKFQHAYNQPSIIVQIPGQANDLVVLGAHFDSTGGSPNARAPGAVDNGSGVVVLLETLRVLMQRGFRPRHTLEFHFYSGEEGGLLGSGDIWRNYKTTRKSVVAFVNTDMAGYSPSNKISVYSDYVDQGLTSYVRLIADGYVGGSTRDTCGYGCSDHASAHANGFPAAYICDEPDATSSPFIHSDKDSYDTVSFDTVLRHTKFVLAFVAESDALASPLQPAIEVVRRRRR